MNAKKLSIGLLTATVVITPFATIQPASARVDAGIDRVVRIDLNGNIKQTISKDRLNHQNTAVANNINEKLEISVLRCKKHGMKTQGESDNEKL